MTSAHVEGAGPTEASPSDDSGGTGLADRLAAWLLAAYLLFGWALLVFWAGRGDWFSFGDWHFLAGPVTRDIWTPVEQHWSTLPALLYRAYFSAFGLEYTPFLATVAALHVGVVALVWRVMIRAGVRSWVAALVVAPLVLFGPGYLSLLFPIQIAQNLSLVFGLGQLLLADHAGRIGRRDWAGLGAGAAGLMSSGVMPPLVLATGLTTLLRRSWRAAAFHTAPLAAMFLTWFWRADPLQDDGLYKVGGYYDPAAHWKFVESATAGSLRAFGGSAALVLLLFVAGLALRLSRQRLWVAVREVALPLALLLIAPIYLALAGYQRSSLTLDYALSSHHLYNALVLYVAAVGVAAEEFVRRWRWTGLLIGAFAATSVYGNADFALDQRHIMHQRRYLQQLEYVVKALAASPRLDRAKVRDPDGGLVLDPLYTRWLTPRWLVENRDAGRIPPPPSPPPPSPRWHTGKVESILAPGRRFRIRSRMER